jgi:hypothetical protein
MNNSRRPMAGIPTARSAAISQTARRCATRVAPTAGPFIKGDIPPRSFLAGAAQHMGPKIEKMAAKAVMAVVMGKGLHSSEMGELLHLLRHVGHAVKEVVDKALDGPEDDNRRKRR